MRLDVYITEKGFVRSRSNAKDFINRGFVSVNGQKEVKVSYNVKTGDIVVVDNSFEYVGRGGEKLEKFFVDFFGDEDSSRGFLLNKSCIDIGSSTGGFTECLLKFGVGNVTAVDVGTGQFNRVLLNRYKNISLHEGVDIRNFKINDKFDIAVTDVSFISVSTLVEKISSLVADGGMLFLLFKPQFEVGQENLKKGIVKNFESVNDKLNNIRDIYARYFENLGIYKSRVAGGDGNQEYFLAFRRHSRELDSMYYEIDKERIAINGTAVRSDAKLFVYNTETDTVIHSKVSELYKFIPHKVNVILNKTKVTKSRLNLFTENGNPVNVNILTNLEMNKDCVKALLSPGRKEGSYLCNKDGLKLFQVLRNSDGVFDLTAICDDEFEVFMYNLFNIIGELPIPNYIDGEIDTKSKEDRYQTLFAEGGGVHGSVAAPTASLHFDDIVFQNLSKINASIIYLNLDVGIGTFSPINFDNFKNNKLHYECYQINESDMTKIKSGEAKNLIVGTTSMRALESAVYTGNLSSCTDIFIHGDYRFKHVDCFMTNFHLPQSSLMLLVDSYLKFKKSKKSIVELYEIAKLEKYRFYSFGDAMLII